jgi:gliding motility-associated-like protein
MLKKLFCELSFSMKTAAFSILLLLLSTVGSFASHIVGVDLYYTWVSGNTYKITLVAYGDCGPASSSAFSSLPSAVPKICIYNGDTYVSSINLAIQPPNFGVEITPVCPADINNTQCTNPSFSIPGIKKFVYSGTYTVPTTSTQWRFVFYGYMGASAGGAGRAAAITNITSGTVIELVDTLNNTVGHNSNPVLSVVPTPFFCLNNNDNYNPGAIDDDIDSLSFALVAARGGPLPAPPATLADCINTGGPTYVAPYTATSPLAASSFSFDSHTGQISFFPNALQRSLVVYNVREYRNGVVVGTSQREMTFLVLTCTNPGPSAPMVGATNGTVVDSTHFSICRNTGTYNIDISATEATTTNLITANVAGLPAGAVATITDNGTENPHVNIAWTSAVAVGSYVFYVTYTDNNCPLASTQTLAYTITVLPSPTVAVALVSAATCLQKAYVNITPGGSGVPWSVLVSRPPADTFQTFSPVTTVMGDSLVPDNYTVTVRSGTNGCMASVPLTIAAPPALVITGTFTNPTYCGVNDGTITVSGLTAGTVNVITFYKNGVLQPAVTVTASTSGTATITGLGAGNYSNIIATYGNCVSGGIGPFVLVYPPLPAVTATFTNPTYCGHNDGTIKLYHLHPGFADTIKFYRDGVLQPSVYLTVAADSTVTITGLYAGVYTNITVNYGPCTSTPIGPVTLVNPTPPTPTVTFTNPSYCGHLDGSITISGLHTGDADTIRFYKDGVLQPAQIFTIPASGSVTITGLGVGVYTNITVTYGPCVSTIPGPITLTTPPVPVPTATFTNPSYCGHLDGTITISGLHAGDVDTITYIFNGVPHAGVSLTVSAAGTVTLTGLGAGVYSNIIATYGPCATTAIGPYTLTNPPIPPTSATFTNPSYCGHFDGTISISGLHAGDVDTISYSLNGIPQAGISMLVPASGTVVITGLGAGVYTNIIARYGPCSTTPLGPITLTNPPLLIPTATATSPTYCAARNGTITISNLYPGDADTIRYTLNGVVQPPVVLTVSASGTVVLTGLDQGVYSNIYAGFNGCTTNTVGPFTLTNPPFTLRNVTYSDPTKCGFCDGKLTFYGLHPGQTDTIRYLLNGTSQPLVSVFIPTDSTVVVPNLCEGIYSNIVVNTTADCVSAVFGPDTLDAPPIIPGFSIAVSKRCEGDSVVCTNSSWPAADLTYVWSFGDGATSTETNPIHVYTASGNYTIKLVITNTRCIDSTTQNITLDNIVIADFNASPDSFLCVGNPVTFTNTSLGVGMNYTWIFGDGTTSTATDVTYTYTATGIYNVALAVSNSAPCYDTARKKIEVDPASAISVSVTDSVLCKGGAITFNAVYAPQGNIGLVWTFSSTDSLKNANPVTYSYENEGTYAITVKALYRACPDTAATLHIKVIPYPFVDLGPDTTICPGSINPIQLFDTRNAANTAARWVWNTGATSSSIYVSEPGTYGVTVNVGGCESSDEVVVANDCYVNIPNVFTPNGDGVNDYFLPRDLLSRGLTEFHMAIFNRWGNLIFETKTVDGRGWDGMYNGEPQPQGVFVYDIDATFKDGQKEHHQGNLTLMR